RRSIVADEDLGADRRILVQHAQQAVLDVSAVVVREDAHRDHRALRRETRFDHRRVPSFPGLPRLSRADRTAAFTIDRAHGDATTAAVVTSVAVAAMLASCSTRPCAARGNRAHDAAAIAAAAMTTGATSRANHVQAAPGRWRWCTTGVHR